MIRIHTLFGAAVLAMGTAAFAGPVVYDFSSDQSVRGLGSFSGTAVYDNTTDKLTLSITNTSKGALTAFAFEVEKGDVAKFERPKHSPWLNEGNRKHMINARPYGTYEGGAAVNGVWGAMGTKSGIAAGHTGTFVFDITGTNASSLTTEDFFTGTKPQIVATFSGFKKTKANPKFRTDRASGFGSAVVTTDITTPGSNTPPNVNPIVDFGPPVIVSPIIKPIGPPSGGTTNAVPLPPAAPAGLMMLGLFGIVAIVRRVRKMMV